MSSNNLVAIYNLDKDNNAVFQGTGFLIDNNGLFITAAHVIHYLDNAFAIIADDMQERYSYELIYKEYIEPKNFRCEPDFDTYLDFALCRINLKTSNFWELSEETIKNEGNYYLMGYKPKDLNVSSQNSVNHQVVKIDAKIAFDFMKLDSCSNLFRNCFTFQTNNSELNSSLMKGTSGSPIIKYDDNKVCGYLFMSQVNTKFPLRYAISSNYIKSIIAKIERNYQL